MPSYSLGGTSWVIHRLARQLDPCWVYVVHARVYVLIYGRIAFDIGLFCLVTTVIYVERLDLSLMRLRALTRAWSYCWVTLRSLRSRTGALVHRSCSEPSLWSCHSGRTRSQSTCSSADVWLRARNYSHAGVWLPGVCRRRHHARDLNGADRFAPIQSYETVHAV